MLDTEPRLYEIVFLDGTAMRVIYDGWEDDLPATLRGEGQAPVCTEDGRRLTIYERGLRSVEFLGNADAAPERDALGDFLQSHPLSPYDPDKWSK